MIFGFDPFSDDRQVETMAEPWDEFDASPSVVRSLPGTAPIVPKDSIAGRSLTAVVAIMTGPTALVSAQGTTGSISGFVTDDTTAALEIARRLWPGPLGAYPDAERKDYVAPYRDETAENRLAPDEFLAEAQRWVEAGVQIIGGCCGYGLPYIKRLRDPGYGVVFTRQTEQVLAKRVP